MFIVMHCSGMPFNGTTIKSSSLGGSETSAYYLAKELAKKGHKVTLFTNSQEEGIWDGVKYVWSGRMDQAMPLGDRFHYYAMNTPHDVLIIQRHPYAFRFNWASKINLWHLHDLAQTRVQGEATAHLWNIDGILTVSEFHKKQICDTWGINPEIVFPIQNGVDLSLFEGNLYDGKGQWNRPYNNPLTTSTHNIGPGCNNKGIDRIHLLYTSRPERGLEHLVMPGGIMERLAAIDSKYHLYVCGYDNTTQHMAEYYQYLWQRCEQLPNVTNLGSLTKQELADIMRQCDALVYPTPGPLQPNFEEVSCITAMEAMAAGLPFISSDVGALSETCKDSGSMLFPLKEDMPDIDMFVDVLKDLFTIEEGRDRPRGDISGTIEKQLEAAKRYNWSIAADMLQDHIDFLIVKNRSNGAIAKQMMRDSDIYVLKDSLRIPIEVFDEITASVFDELNECYRFAFENTWDEHYAKVYNREAERGVDYGPENLNGSGRFEHVSSIIASLNPGSVVLDYGCAHGHYTINLAKRFPELGFVGVDITLSNVEKARAWAEQEGVNNARFIHGRIDEESEGIKILEQSKDIPLTWSLPSYDAIIAAEVLEHVGTPQEHAAILCTYLKPEGKMIITTPFGPWEAIGYKEHWPWRAHIWHFERKDLHDMWGSCPEFNIAVAPSGNTKEGDVLGSYITTFKNPEGPILHSNIDIDYKVKMACPRQTVSLCMIVKDAEADLKRCLDSVCNIVDEIIIALDQTTSDHTLEVIDRWRQHDNGYLWPIVKVVPIDSPTKIGFDEARNLSIKEASGDWILWLDSDEILIHPDNIFKYLRNNCYDGYAIQQHHFSIEPLGVLKTDLPCRLFRNHKGVRFFGVVHEHPEIELNKGVGYVQLIPDMEIAHQGYTTEMVRRGRFHRNIDLLVRDRKKYPDRVLGKFLWMRDLAQMCRYELEHNGNSITETMIVRAHEGIKLWEELLADNHLRMILDGMEFYSFLNQVLGVGINFTMMLEASDMSSEVKLNGAKQITARFNSVEHIEKLFSTIVDNKVRGYNGKYF